MIPLLLRYFDFKNGMPNPLLDFYEDFNKIAIAQKSTDNLPKYRV